MKVCDGLHAFIWESMTANNCNTYLIDGPARVLIDPGHAHLFEHVASELRELGIQLADIDLVLATHAHADHFEAARLFKDLPARFAMSEGDWRAIEEAAKYMGATFDVEAYRPDFFLGSGNLVVKGVELEIIHAPGHSSGSIALYQPDQRALFSGDVIFQDGLGRTDLPGGNGAQLKESIKMLAALEAEWLLPGHGQIVSGSSAVKANFRRVEEFWFGYI